VQISPDLVEEFVSHFDRLRRAGKRTDAEAYAFPNVRAAGASASPRSSATPPSMPRTC
jgi:hypothetical protein